jgi:hypothetical protein
LNRRPAPSSGAGGIRAAPRQHDDRSGPALIRPDFPELLEWPFLWQQTEYVLGGGTTDYLFLALAADHVLNRSVDPEGSTSINSGAH